MLCFHWWFKFNSLTCIGLFLDFRFVACRINLVLSLNLHVNVRNAMRCKHTEINSALQNIPICIYICRVTHVSRPHWWSSQLYVTENILQDLYEPCSKQEWVKSRQYLQRYFIKANSQLEMSPSQWYFIKANSQLEISTWGADILHGRNSSYTECDISLWWILLMRRKMNVIPSQK